MNRILVVDDDAHILDVICFALKKAGYSYECAHDGKVAIEKAETFVPDLVILDIGLPEMDGLEVCRQIRRSSEVPILFLSARSDEIDRVLGLEIGGDDYVTKPFSPRELVARVSVILKRMQGASEAAPDQTGILTKGTVRLDTQHRSAAVGENAVDLTALEFNILQTLLARPRMAFTRDQIMTLAYDANIHVSDRTIDSHIRNIRGKFKRAGCDNAIETVHGIGFRIGSCGMSD
ncbi:MAG: response regulator [Pseudomonadota bacterium]